MTELQQIILDIFKEVKKLCEDNGIDYYAIGGTCIGAVRHKGFIPWDDDLDIAVPAEQYEDFIRLAKEKLPSHLQLIDHNDREHFRRVFVKVADKRTTYVQTYMTDYPDEYYGVFIDIMPMSGKPEGKAGERYVKKMAFYTYISQQFVRSYKENPALREKLSWLFLRPLFFLPRNHYFKKWRKEILKHPVKGSKLICFPWNIKVRWRSFSHEVFDGYEELPFEDTTIRCPKQWDTYLSTDFGDYMKLPPEEKRQNIHPGFYDTHKPCEEYAKEVKEKSQR